MQRIYCDGPYAGVPVNEVVRAADRLSPPELTPTGRYVLSLLDGRTK